MMEMTYAEIVEAARQLDTEAKEDLIRLLRVCLIEERRREIAGNALRASCEHVLGKTNSGSVEDLITDLYTED